MDKAVANYKPAPEENVAIGIQTKTPERWQMSYNASLLVQNHFFFPPPGVFPEQSSHGIGPKRSSARLPANPKPSIYLDIRHCLPGGRPCRCCVTHLDASNKVVTLANENKMLSRLDDLPIPGSRRRPQIVQREPDWLKI